jgi:hypothetical protein
MEIMTIRSKTLGGDGWRVCGSSNSGHDANHISHEDHTGIMRRAAPPRVRHRLRQTRSETDPISELGDQQRARVTRDILAVTGHPHPHRRTCSFISEVPFWLDHCRLNNRSFSHQKGLFRGRAGAINDPLLKDPG